LVHANDKDDFFFPYMESLPKSIKEYPYFYGKKELELLKGSEFLKDVERRKKDIENDFIDMTVRYPKLKKYSFWDWIRFHMLVESRLFNQHINGTDYKLMVPVSDLFNHNTTHNAEWRYDEKTDNFEIYAIKGIKKGQTITLNYGWKSNLELLTEYGFTLSDYNNTDLLLKYSPPKHGLVYNPNDLNLDIEVGYFGGKVLNSSSLKNYRKMAELDDIDKEKNFTLPISIDNEVKAIQILEKILVDKIAKYPTSLEHDSKRVKNKNISQNERNILNVLIEEKMMFTKALEKARVIIKLLTNYSDKNINIIKRSVIDKDKKFEQYFNTLIKTLNLKIYFES